MVGYWVILYYGGMLVEDKFRSSGLWGLVANECLQTAQLTFLSADPSGLRPVSQSAQRHLWSVAASD
ncbi:hypothetical protein ACOMHN_028260 [Nucella lapillus]